MIDLSINGSLIVLMWKYRNIHLQERKSIYLFVYSFKHLYV